jgi:hypothetical protein
VVAPQDHISLGSDEGDPVIPGAVALFLSLFAWEALVCTLLLLLFGGKVNGDW